MTSSLFTLRAWQSSRTTSFQVFPLVLNPQLHAPYISSPSHRHLLATHDRTSAACSAAIPMLCHLPLVSLSAPHLVSVIKHTMDSIFSYSNTSAQCMVHANWPAAVQNYFFNSYGPSSPEMNANNYSARFMESYGIMNMSCKSAILKKSSSKWVNSGKPLTQHLRGTIFAFACFPTYSRKTTVRWGEKKLSEQHLFQKLPKSVDMCWSYSVQHQCRF